MVIKAGGELSGAEQTEGRGEGRDQRLPSEGVKRKRGESERVRERERKLIY